MQGASAVPVTRHLDFRKMGPSEGLPAGPPEQGRKHVDNIEPQTDAEEERAADLGGITGQLYPIF